ncbi:hypothetical protein QVD17_01217 [Tagetes erecta]|uniref:Uncharacterized protein n=1 Tax=Tagetes erecta TaxID=13708 RepID=A0AAD8P7Q4_TARER|nr:hypothetical protein QVD17_01217 [Tagetes erecta]
MLTIRTYQNKHIHKHTTTHKHKYCTREQLNPHSLPHSLYLFSLFTRALSLYLLFHSLYLLLLPLQLNFAIFNSCKLLFIGFKR